MRKSTKTIIITLIIYSFALASASGANAAIRPGYSFKDTAQHWSAQVVESASALELIKGYPGELFKPENTVSRLEAIAIIIRALGKEAEASKLDYKKSGIKLPPGMSWGQGHLVLAVQLGMLHKDYVYQLKYNEPITRAEVATLVATALGLELKDNPTLPFTDMDAVADVYKKYVAAVTEQGIMEGLGKNQFGPGQSMKRGQMAALMARLALEGWFPHSVDRVIQGSRCLIKGVIAGKNDRSGSVKLETQAGEILNKQFADRPAIFRGDSAIAMADVRVGLLATAILNSSGKIQYIMVDTEQTLPEDQTEITGRVASISQDTVNLTDQAGRKLSYPLAKVFIISGGAGNQDPSLITAGHYVTCSVKNSKINSIQVLDTARISGKLSEVAQDYIIINVGGNLLTYNTQESIFLDDAGVGLTAGQIQRGSQVEVLYSGVRALEIYLQKSLEDEGEWLEGTVTDLLNRSRARLYIDREPYYLSEDVIITKEEKQIDMDNIFIGVKIRAKTDSQDNISHIDIADDQNVRLEGIVSGKSSSDGWIKIEQETNFEFKFQLDRRCNFTDTTDYSSGVEDLGDIRNGWQVRLTLEDGEVASIRVMDR